MESNHKVFIDSNVWFSFFWGSVTIRRLLARLLDKETTALVSELVLKEVVDNIKLKDTDKLEMAKEFLMNFPLTVVKNSEEKTLQKMKDLADKKDLSILASAVSYGCNYLITGNLKDFRIKKIKKKYGLQVISPSDFLKKI